MKTLYFDCFAGASGNMILGGLAALGIDKAELVGQLKTLRIPDFEIDFTTVDRSGVSSIHAEVRVPKETAHRHFHQIETIIDSSGLSVAVKKRAKAIFRRLAEAEAKVHGIEVERVHFHEVGAMDAIIDVAGACVGFELLGIESFACSKIHLGSGFVDMAHGKFPVPPPAVAELLKAVPVYSTEIEGELMTPTGAAIIITLCDSYGSIPEMEVEHLGYGAGTREYEKFPNVLRMIVGDVKTQAMDTSGNSIPLLDRRGAAARRNIPPRTSGTPPIQEGSFGPLTNDHLLLLETNIDDMSPQVLGYVMERAFEVGALDCWFTPIHMKKNRPAILLSVLCKPEEKDELTDLIYSETTTLGIRIQAVERNCLDREIVKVKTEFGTVEVKIGKLRGKVVNVMPEYEQVKVLAVKNKVPFRTVRGAVLTELSKTNQCSKSEPHALAGGFLSAP